MTSTTTTTIATALAHTAGELHSLAERLGGLFEAAEAHPDDEGKAHAAAELSNEVMALAREVGDGAFMVRERKTH